MHIQTSNIFRTQKLISITTGDPDGIGPEVTAKALNQLGYQQNFLYILWRDQNFKKLYLDLIDKKFTRIKLKSFDEIFKDQTIQKILNCHNPIIDICESTSAPLWIEENTMQGIQKKIHALVTAPLSKTLIHKSGLKDKGHTDIFKRVCNNENIFMVFLGELFNVLLLTDHIPLKDVSNKIKSLNLIDVFQNIFDFKNQQLNFNLPMALLGLNPHAGENGILGDEELLLKPTLDNFKDIINGPFVPDVIFKQKYWKKFSIYLSLYHDQGLIPFKMAHDNKNSCQYSLGLPFIRTSVDHGTAKDIFGKDIANPQSMKFALTKAISFIKD